MSLNSFEIVLIFDSFMFQKINFNNRRFQIVKIMKQQKMIYADELLKKNVAKYVQLKKKNSI